MESNDRSQTIGGLQSRIAETLDAVTDAQRRIAGRTDDRSAELRVRNAHDELIDAYGNLVGALTRTETVLDGFENGPETPRQIMSEHGDRLEEQYDGPVWYLAVQLTEYNRREYLWQKPETNGGDKVRRHGLTENQRSWLNDLQDAWRAYDGGDSDAA